MVSKGQIVGIDWNRIAWLHSHVLVHMNSLTASRCHINASHMVEHPTRSRRVVGSNPIWGSDFFRVYVSPRIYVISCCCYFSVKFIWLRLATKLSQVTVNFTPNLFVLLNYIAKTTNVSLLAFFKIVNYLY